jgi:hypothetical protein
MFKHDPKREQIAAIKARLDSVLTDIWLYFIVDVVFHIVDVTFKEYLKTVRIMQGYLIRRPEPRHLFLTLCDEYITTTFPKDVLLHTSIDRHGIWRQAFQKLLSTDMELAGLANCELITFADACLIVVYPTFPTLERHNAGCSQLVDIASKNLDTY